MLFNRLAEAEIQLPDPDVQIRASQALREIKSLRQAVDAKLTELGLLPRKILARAFES
jgi:type I restriction enzyme S subunit